MPDREPFTDLYEVLQVNPHCDLKMIENAYRHLAKIYHPDHEKTADVDRFSAVIDAWNVLKFPEKRARYDEIYRARNGHPEAPAEESELSGDVALGDAALQRNILMYLYKSRRENFAGGGVGAYTLQDHFRCSDDNFEFHVWYLRSKGFIEVTEAGTLAITVGGVDHVISLHQPKEPSRRLTDQSGAA
ncbi:DnaJ domain-containing protein [Novosphingobium sp.]|uniref:DnaJ domain-containing protein n=1 Tax=Novosphingobium sp. TaxID=1874826 RepID=UPI0025E91531|nr:DnaJ domain-containing protein [Novosphingobium sp.]